MGHLETSNSSCNEAKERENNQSFKRNVLYRIPS